MNILKDNGYEVSCIGKINDIFNGEGVTKTQRTLNNEDGMVKTMYEAKRDFTGFCFVNLVEFDSEYGHRRNPKAYGAAIEEFDHQLGQLISYLNEDDLLIVTADHGNDPTWKGTDHTREKVPVILYSKSFTKGRKLEEASSFADMGKTIIENFGLKGNDSLIGEVIKPVFED
jgi:phosphopentomutase